MKKYIPTVVICFLGTQISGIVFGTSYFLIMLNDPSLADGELLKVIPVCLGAGTVITIIPSWIYAMTMSYFILNNRQKETSQWFDFSISAVLVGFVYYLALGIIFRSDAMDMLKMPLIIPALGAGFVGVAITHLYLNRNKKNIHNNEAIDAHD
jgi:uncharacterized membrane protein YesL